MKKLNLITVILMMQVICMGQIIHVPTDQPTIQAAIDVAIHSDTILVEDGTYYENINFLGKAITVSSHYLIENDSSHIYNTIINGSQPNPTDSACVVLFNSNEDTTSVLNGFTITGGSGCIWPDHPLFQNMKGGGGIQIINCGAKITHNIVADNHVNNAFEAFGGGIQGADLPQDKMIIIEDNLVCNNTVTGNLWVKGGGIVVAFCHTRICNNIVKNNIVTGDNITHYTAAGGIWYSTATSYVCDVLIKGNEVFDNELISLSSSSSGTWGGGIVVLSMGSNINPVISKNLIYNNRTVAPDHTYGNGIVINQCNTAEFTENIVYGNTFESPVSSGGGLLIRNSHPMVSRNLIYDNMATQGGGIYVGFQTISEPQFFNNTICGNDATEAGGGIYLKNAACSANNNIIWNNTAPETPGILIENSTVDVNYSLVEGWVGPGTGNLDEDPLLADPENGDFHLTENSPCINAGDPTAPLDPDGTICDIGRYCFHQGTLINVPGHYATIQEGIEAATEGDTVLVAEGLYYENINFLGKAITVASQFIIDLDETHIDNTIIDGSQAANPEMASTVMFINGEDTTSIINGFTITGGSGVFNTILGIKFGGGICCNDAGAKILNNKIIENHISHDDRAGGAGIGCRGPYGDYWVIIKDNIISNNSSTATGSSAFGGGIYSGINTIIKYNTIEYNQCENYNDLVDGGGIEIEQWAGDKLTVEVYGNIIQYNTIEGYRGQGAGMLISQAEALIQENSIKFNAVIVEHNGNGGGIWINNPLDGISMLNNDISDNSITAGNYGRGGGVVFWNPQSELLVADNKINNNVTDALECRGSGVLFRCNLYPTGRIEVSRNEFIGNIGNLNANGCNGGGVCLNDAWDTLVVFDANRFESNTAIYGGGLFSRRSYNLQLTNNLFLNDTSDIGGGIFLYHYYSDEQKATCPQIVNNTFFGNYSNYGGGIGMSCETNIPAIINNIFRENQAPNSNDIYYYSGTDSIFISYNNIDEDEIFGPWTGNGNINEDPLFTGTGDHPFSLQDISPCVNTGTPDLTGLNLQEFDLAGNQRLFGGRIEMGAYENQNVIVGMDDAFNQSNLELSILPNPFSNQTTIEFTLPESEFVTLSIYDVTGKHLKTILSKKLSKGNHKIRCNAEGLNEGIYFIRLETKNSSIVQKAIIMK